VATDLKDELKKNDLQSSSSSSQGFTGNYGGDQGGSGEEDDESQSETLLTVLHQPGNQQVMEVPLAAAQEQQQDFQSSNVNNANNNYQLEAVSTALAADAVAVKEEKVNGEGCNKENLLNVGNSKPAGVNFITPPATPLENSPLTKRMVVTSILNLNEAAAAAAGKTLIDSSSTAAGATAINDNRDVLNMNDDGKLVDEILEFVKNDVM
jgi:hypothetical protein